MVKNIPASAGDLSSIPAQGTKIPHASGQLEKPMYCSEEPVQPKNFLLNNKKFKTMP